MEVSISPEIKKLLNDKDESKHSDFIYKTVILPRQFNRIGVQFEPRFENNDIKFFINGVDRTEYVNKRLNTIKKRLLPRKRIK